MRRYILAHDFGTSGNKATLFDEQGQLAASHTSAYETRFFNGNWAEQDPSSWWAAVCESSRKVIAQIDPSEIAGVSFSGQMMACLCLDAKGNPLHDAMIYCDQRSEKQSEQLSEAVGVRELYEITGNRPSPTYTLDKLMWIRDNRPDIFSQVHKVMQAKDYISYKLTGVYATDCNDASGTHAFDMKSFSWSEQILGAVDIPMHMFPEVHPSSAVIGEVHREAAQQTGIPAGTPVVVGSGDGGAATLGAGSVSPGRPYCCMGSTAWVSMTSSAPVNDPQMRVFTFAHPVEGLYQPCATMQAAGSAFNWFAGVLRGSTEAEIMEELNDLAAESTPGANGVLFLPYLMGERSPWWNTQARAEFLGMHMNTSTADLCRAVIEGIAMNLDISLRIMLAEQPKAPVMFIGGGARGRIWREVFSDVFASRITIPSLLTEASSMGAALLGGVGTGLYPDFSMVDQMNPVTSTVEPHMELEGLYKKKRSLFSRAYRAIEPLFDEMD